VVICRGDIWWANLPEPADSEPGYRRPVVVVQSDAFNRSKISTIVAVTLNTQLNLADHDGNVLLLASETGLPKDSVANVSQFITVDRRRMSERIGKLADNVMDEVDEGLRIILAL